MSLLRRRGGISPGLLGSRQVQDLVAEYSRIFNLSIRPTLESGAIPEAMANRLRDDIFLFSGFKTYQGLKEASRLLRDDDGQVKPFHRFYNDITAIKEDYNKHWLKAEYIFATQSAQMAAKWKDFEEDGDRYNLQYRTAGDGKVRPGHKVLHNITLPLSDPFWEEFFPPNGWRCRCTVVQVRKGKYPESDSATSIQQGREATYQTGKSGVNKAAIFRFNPGRQQVVFPPRHPYYEVSLREREAIEKALSPETERYTRVPTTNGTIRIHADHGKNERAENIRVASYFADKYGYEIDLLPRDDNKPCADAFNRTLGYEEEYKVNATASRNAVDKMIQKAAKQADRIVLWVDSDISMEDLSFVLNNRVKRCPNVGSVTIVMGGEDHTYGKDEIVKDGFLIKQADLK